MLVKAKCVIETWNSSECVMCKPGAGPFPEGLYEIEREGILAKMKNAKGTYHFEFDRNAGPDDKPHDYSCKREGCGKKFSTLADLGTHTKVDHKEVRVESDEEVVLAKDMRGQHRKGKTFTCKTLGCGVVLPNLYALKIHKRLHVAKNTIEEVVEAEPALA